ncbi:hypothetical protein P7K49_001991, partial [Saguinus oedipus]
MLEDPTWLGRYLEYVEKFHLQRAPIFNMDSEHCPSHILERDGRRARGSGASSSQPAPRR